MVNTDWGVRFPVQLANLTQKMMEVCKTRVIGSEVCTVVTSKLDRACGYTENGNPIMFVTEIIGGRYGGYTKTYTTQRRAWSGHQIIVRNVKQNKLITKKNEDNTSGD